MTDPTDQARERLATSFGYQEVRPQDKSRLVGEMFARVAARYDLMNDLMSVGVHRLWKAAMIDWLAPRPGVRLLDVAGGTGDIAFRVLDRLARRGDPRRASSSATSIPPMLEVGRDRAIDANRLDAIDWLCADAEALPLARSQRRCLHHRVRHPQRHPDRPGPGRSQACPGAGRPVSLPRVRRPCRCRRCGAAYDAYSFTVLPWLGERVAGDQAAYRYLAESIRRFPDQATFARMIERAGFDRVRYRDLSGGIAALHSAWRL